MCGLVYVICVSDSVFPQQSFESREGLCVFNMLWKVVPEPDCTGEEGVFVAIYIRVWDWEVEAATLVSCPGGFNFPNQVIEGELNRPRFYPMEEMEFGQGSKGS